MEGTCWWPSFYDMRHWRLTGNNINDEEFFYFLFWKDPCLSVNFLLGDSFWTKGICNLWSHRCVIWDIILPKLCSTPTPLLRIFDSLFVALSLSLSCVSAVLGALFFGSKFDWSQYSNLLYTCKTGTSSTVSWICISGLLTVARVTWAYVGRLSWNFTLSFSAKFMWEFRVFLKSSWDFFTRASCWCRRNLSNGGVSRASRTLLFNSFSIWSLIVIVHMESRSNERRFSKGLVELYHLKSHSVKWNCSCIYAR